MENAVKTQVYIAVITYTLVAIIRQQLKTEYTTITSENTLGVFVYQDARHRRLTKIPAPKCITKLSVARF
jgi:hypothetical protein